MTFKVEVKGGIQALVVNVTGVKIDKTEEGRSILVLSTGVDCSPYPLYVGDNVWVDGRLIWEES